MTNEELKAIREAVASQYVFTKPGTVVRDMWHDFEIVLGELAIIDFMLERRTALDDKPSRVAKIQHALDTAAKAAPASPRDKSVSERP